MTLGPSATCCPEPTHRHHYAPADASSSRLRSHRCRSPVAQRHGPPCRRRLPVDVAHACVYVRILVFGRAQLRGEFRVCVSDAVALPLRVPLIAGPLQSETASRALPAQSTQRKRLDRGDRNPPDLRSRLDQQTGPEPLSAWHDGAHAIAGGIADRAVADVSLVVRTGAVSAVAYPADGQRFREPGDILTICQRRCERLAHANRFGSIEGS